MDDLLKKPIKLYPHQTEAVFKCYAVLKKYGLVYLFGEPRSGKTLTSLECARLFCNNNGLSSILILTKKAAIKGWEEAITSMEDELRGLDVVVTNYEQAVKLNPGNRPGIYIQDESHNLGRVGKPTKRYKAIKRLVHNSPLIMLSGTPIIETPGSIYYQSTVSKYSPFDEFKNFYEFHRAYGVPNLKRVGGILVESYTKYKPELLTLINKYVVTLTLADAGHKFKNEDEIHYITPTKHFKESCKSIIKNRLYRNMEIDSISRLRTLLHLLESGLYYDKNQKWHEIELYSKFKLRYLIKNFKGKKTAIMCYFKAEQEFLSNLFRLIPEFTVFSSTADCEGVDLSKFDELVIYSQDYSGAKFVQRRNRIVNLKRKTNTKVHYLIFKGGISEQIYNCVSQKKNFNDSLFDKRIYQ